jgi:hypothetical protein
LGITPKLPKEGDVRDPFASRTETLACIPIVSPPRVQLPCAAYPRRTSLDRRPPSLPAEPADHLLRGSQATGWPSTSSPRPATSSARRPHLPRRALLSCRQTMDYGSGRSAAKEVLCAGPRRATAPTISPVHHAPTACDKGRVGEGRVEQGRSGRSHYFWLSRSLSALESVISGQFWFGAVFLTRSVGLC